MEDLFEFDHEISNLLHKGGGAPAHGGLREMHAVQELWLPVSPTKNRCRHVDHSLDLL
jgi:hypothetical protein